MMNKRDKLSLNIQVLEGLREDGYTPFRARFNAMELLGDLNDEELILYAYLVATAALAGDHY